MRRNELQCALKTLVFVLLDLGWALGCLCFHGPNFSGQNLHDQFTSPYSFRHSLLDLFGITLLRIAIISSGSLILLLKRRNKAKLLGKLAHVSFSSCILFCSFSPTKLLALSDQSAATPDHPALVFPGDWAYFAGNFFFSILAHRLWLNLLRTAEKNELSGQEYERLRDSTDSEESAEGEEATASDSRTFEIIVRLLQYAKNEWIWHLSGFTWLFIYSLTRIFVPYYTGSVIASVIATSGDRYSALLDSVKLMLFISVVSALAGGFRGGSFEYAYARINRAVRHNLFTSLVKQEVAFFDKHKTGEITSRLTADTQTMSDTVALNINVFLRNMVQMGGSMLFMLYLCWRLSLVPFIVVPVILVASKIFGVYYDILSEKVQEAVAHSNDVAEEVLSTMRTVRSFACEEVEAIRFYGKLTSTLAVTKKKAFAYVGYLWVNELFQTVINVAVLWYGGYLVLTKQLEKDLLVSFLLYQMQLADNIRQLGDVWTGLMQSVGASRKVFEYIDRKPEIDTNGSYTPNHVAGKIEFQNVHFSYPTRQETPVLRGLSFTVEPGEVVALVGPSGSGKSSCIALLENFYSPIAGKVLVDGVLVKDYEHHFIHTKIALVGQEPVLFARSVAENIAYGIDNCTTIDVVESAKMANAHSFITELREQYETNVGEKGSQMSGGQKQRIAIARALVRKPAILLLDEATSALDTESEHLVQEAIYKNLKGHSVILIAHRLSTVEKADKIVVISSGRVAQMGSHEELLAQEGIYKQLVQRQMISVGTGAGVLDNGQSSPVPNPDAENDGTEDGDDQPGPSHTRVIPGLSVSPRTMAHSLLATSFTQSTTSMQSK